MFFRQTLGTFGGKHIQSGYNGGAHACGGHCHIGQAGFHGSGGAAHIGSIPGGQLRGYRHDIGAVLQLILIQHGNGCLRSAGPGAALDSDRQVRVCQRGIRNAHGLARNDSHLRGGSVGVSTCQTRSFAQAARHIIGSALYKAVGIYKRDNRNAERIAQTYKTRGLGHAIAAQHILGALVATIPTTLPATVASAV